MAIARAFGKGRAIARVQHSLAAVLYERQLAFEYVDELILVTVPVTLTRPATRRQSHQIDAEIAQTPRLPQSPPRARRTRRVKWRRIAAALANGDSRDIDLGHAPLLIRFKA